MTFKAKKLTISVSKDIGKISSILIQPAGFYTMLALSHGAGANMYHHFMESLSQSLAVQGVATLRFNFPYMEKGGGPPDRPKKAHPAIVSAVTRAIKYAEGKTVLVGGKSFGGRMSSQVAALGLLPEAVKGLVYFGFPLHAPGKPGIGRAAHLSDISIPQLFLQGTRDTLAQYDLIQEVCQSLPLAKLVKMEGGDHSFKTLKRSGISMEEVLETLATKTADFGKSITE